MSGAWGIPELAVSFLMAGKSHVHAYATHCNKIATCDFGTVTVISCARALFFVYIWIISWDATNRSVIQCYTDR